MAALAAKQHNAVLTPFAQRLQARGNAGPVLAATGVILMVGSALYLFGQLIANTLLRARSPAPH